MHANRKIFSFSVSLFVIGVLYLLVQRLFFGVDLQDEAFYCALPKSFAEGRIPFREELNGAQAAGILLTPLASLFLLFSAKAEGIVVFFRITYFLSLCGLSFFAFEKIKKHIPVLEALLAALLLLSFWPFAIPSLSYNTMGALFLNCGLLALFSQEEKKQMDWRLPVGLLFLGTSVFCYVTLILPIAVALGLFFRFSRNKKWPLPSRVASATVLAGFILLALYLTFLYIGMARLGLISHYIDSFGDTGGGLKKFLVLFAQLKHNLLFVSLITIGTWLIIFSAKRIPQLAILLTLLLGWSLFRFPFVITILPFHLSILAYTLTGLPMALDRKREQKFPFWRSVSLISCMFGIVCAWSSSNGLTNFAVMSSLGILGGAWYISDSLNGRGLTARAAGVLLLGIFLTFQVRSLYTNVYGDDSNLKLLNRIVTSGPYRFLKTSPAKTEFIDTLSSDLGNSVPDGVAFYESFVSGYLFTNAKIKAPTLWAYSLKQGGYDREIFARFYQDPENRPETLFWLHTLPVLTGFEEHLDHELPDPLKNEVAAHYGLKSKSKYYSIYQRKD